MASISNIRKKRGRPAIGATPIMVRMPPVELGELDGWIKRQSEKPSRPEAIRRLVEMVLSGSDPTKHTSRKADRYRGPPMTLANGNRHICERKGVPMRFGGILTTAIGLLLAPAGMANAEKILKSEPREGYLRPESGCWWTMARVPAVRSKKLLAAAIGSIKLLFRGRGHRARSSAFHDDRHHDTTSRARGLTGAQWRRNQIAGIAQAGPLDWGSGYLRARE
jgi:hypothetical protein